MSRVSPSPPDVAAAPPPRGATSSAPAATRSSASRPRRFGIMPIVLGAVALVAVLSADFLVPFVTTDLQGRARTLFTDYDVMAAAGAQARLGHLERAYDYDWMVRAAPSMGVPTTVVPLPVARRRWACTSPSSPS